VDLGTQWGRCHDIVRVDLKSVRLQVIILDIGLDRNLTADLCGNATT
jgi:hypothetical protein